MTLHSWSSCLHLPILLGLQAHTTTQGSPFLVSLKTMFSYFLRNGGGGGGMARQFLCGVQTQEVCALTSGSRGWEIPDDLLMWLAISFKGWPPTAIFSLSFLLRASWPAQQSELAGRWLLWELCLLSGHRVLPSAAAPMGEGRGRLCLWLRVIVSHYKVIDGY